MGGLPWWQIPEVYWVAAGLVLLLGEMYPKPRLPLDVGTISSCLFALLLVQSLQWPGDAAPSLGGLYVWDGSAALFKRLFLATGFCVSLMMQRQIPRESAFRGEMFALLWFALAGMGLMASLNHFIMLFVAVELLTITFYILVSHPRDRAVPLEAGVKYLILGALSTAFLVYGMAWLFGVTGSLSFAGVGAALAAGDCGPGALLGVGLVLAGLGFKLAACPFQWWAPDVYQGAPTPVTAFLAVGSKAAAVVATWRVLSVAFAPVAADCTPVLAVVAGLSILAGNLGALAQRDFKRLLAYSGISHAGFLLMGLVAGGATGFSAVLFYLIAYAASAMLVFYVFAGIEREVGGSEISRLAGLGRTNPAAAWLMGIGLLSLAGIPPLVGFVGKWMVFAAAWDAGQRLLCWVAVAGVVASIAYYLAPLRVMFLDQTPEDARPPVKLSAFYGGVAVVLAMAVALISLAPGAVSRIVVAALK
jgi:NADH-quinone oxidoreductase subunit N